MNSTLKGLSICFLLTVLGELPTQTALANLTADNNSTTSLSNSTATNTSPQPVYDTSASLFSFQRSSIVIQAGAFNATQGEEQDIGIQGLIGDRFTLHDSHDQNALFGLGYYIDGLDTTRLSLLYGIDAFYLAPTEVKGDIVQEQMFTNLSYQYSITNTPVYASAKALIKSKGGKYDVTFDLGVGPNFLNTSDFKEKSIDRGITIPDRAFSGDTDTTLSATVGMGIRFNNVFGKIPLELDYRFFYLGEGSLDKINDQFTDTLKTGNIYVNALMLSIAF